MTAPLKIDPDTLYPLTWLEQQLEGVMQLRSFLEALGLSKTGEKRLHQDALWGHEIIEAMRHVTEHQPATSAKPQPAVANAQTSRPAAAQPKRGRPPRTAPGLTPIRLK